MTSPLLHLGFPSIQMPEIILILVIVLIIFGPKSLPSLGRALGNGLREFKRASNKLSNAWTDAVEEEEAKQRMDEEGGAQGEPRQIESKPRYAASTPKDTVATSQSAPPEEKH